MPNKECVQVLFVFFKSPINFYDDITFAEDHNFFPLKATKYLTGSLWRALTYAMGTLRRPATGLLVPRSKSCHLVECGQSHMKWPSYGIPDMFVISSCIIIDQYCIITMYFGKSVICFRIWWAFLIYNDTIKWEAQVDFYYPKPTCISIQKMPFVYAACKGRVKAVFKSKNKLVITNLYITPKGGILRKLQKTSY